MNAPPAWHRLRGHGLLVRMLSSAIISQALLSLVNFAIGLLLIRHAPEDQYGRYVLAFNGVLLLTGLQAAFIQPPMVMRMYSGELAERARLIGGLYRGQQRWVLAGSTALLGILAALYAAGAVDHVLLLLLVAAVASIATALYREFFRMVLFAYRLPTHVLLADILFVVLQLVGAGLAAISPAPATAMLAASSVAAVVAGRILSRMLWRREPWDRGASPSVLREMAPVGGWAAAGSASHWAFSQGYNYLVAGVLDVSAVSALAATRLTMMPINLISTGVGPLLMPLATEWLQRFGPSLVWRRMLFIASGLVLAAFVYLVGLWILRDWIFATLMHKHFAQGDTLLELWAVAFLIMAFREPLRSLPSASGQFKAMCLAAIFTAGVSLVVAFGAVSWRGVVGAPLAIIIGELISLAYVLVLCMNIIRDARPGKLARAEAG